MSNSRTSPTDTFDQDLRAQLRAYADLAPTTVRGIADSADAGMPTGSGRVELLPGRTIDLGADDLELEADIVDLADRRRRRRAVGAGASAIVLLGGIGLTSLAASSGTPGGPDTPEAAVTEFVDALDDGDVLGALAAIDPAEGRAMTDSLLALIDESLRTGLLDESPDLEATAGIELDVSEMTLASERVTNDIAVVSATGGTATLGVDLEALPVAADLLELTADPGSATATNSSTTIPLVDLGLELATIRRDGAWYVSPTLSIAEAVRRSAGASIPDTPLGPQVGFDTPDEAASEFYRRAAALDVDGLIVLAAPGEADALARYAPLWIDGVNASLDSARSEGVQLQLDALTLDVSTPARATGEVRHVVPSAWSLSGTLPPPGADDGFPPYDPSLATLINDSGPNGTLWLLPAGVVLPDDLTGDSLDAVLAPDGTVDEAAAAALGVAGLELLDFYPDEETNFALVEFDGSIRRFWTIAPAEPLGDDPQPFAISWDGQCQTASGLSLLFGQSEPSTVCLDDGQPAQLGGSVLSLLLFRPLGGSAVPLVQVPAIDVVAVDGQWYVSPVRTVMSGLIDELSAVDDGAALSIDSPLASIVFGTSRVGLEQSTNGLPAGELPAECAAVFVPGTTQVVPEPTAREARDCQEALWNSPGFGFGFEETVTIETVPAGG